AEAIIASLEIAKCQQTMAEADPGAPVRRPRHQIWPQMDRRGFVLVQLLMGLAEPKQRIGKAGIKRQEAGEHRLGLGMPAALEQQKAELRTECRHHGHRFDAALERVDRFIEAFERYQNMRELGE